MASKKASKKRRKSAGSTPNRSDFVRENKDLPTNEIIEKAKAHGLSISKSLVYAVRSRAAGGTSGAKGEGRGRARGNGSTASDFIREKLAGGMTPREIMDAGKAAGLNFSSNLVYAVKTKIGSGKGKAAPRRGGSASGAAGPNETEFKRMAFDLGLPRARQLLDELERALAQLLR